MCVELDLPGAVEDGEGFFIAVAEGFIEPVEVVEEESGGLRGWLDYI